MHPAGLEAVEMHMLSLGKKTNNKKTPTHTTKKHTQKTKTTQPPKTTTHKRLQTDLQLYQNIK